MANQRRLGWMAVAVGAAALGFARVNSCMAQDQNESSREAPKHRERYSSYEKQSSRKYSNEKTQKPEEQVKAAEVPVQNSGIAPTYYGNTGPYTQGASVYGYYDRLGIWHATGYFDMGGYWHPADVSGK